MSVDRINEFKSSILDEVYRHQGFLTSVSRVVDSYDEDKKSQLSGLIREQQEAINKSLGLIYAFFRTANSFDIKEEEIKQIVGNDLDNAFSFEEAVDISVAQEQNSVQTEVETTDSNVANTSVFDGQVEVPINDAPVDVQAEVTPVTEANANASGLFDTTEMIETNNVVEQPIDNANVSVDVAPAAETVVVNEVADAPTVTAEVAPVSEVADVNIVAPDTPAPENSAVTDFVLSPIEEGVAPEKVEVVPDANVAVADSATVEVAAPIVTENQTAPAAEVPAAEVAPAPVADSSAVAVEGQVSPVEETPAVAVETQASQSKVRYTRKTSQPPKAILVTVNQISKLSGSRSVQAALLNGESVSQVMPVVTEDVPSDPQQQVQYLMDKASQAYAEGKNDEAQAYMNQVSELNKLIQGGQTEGGVTLVKK